MLGVVIRYPRRRPFLLALILVVIDDRRRSSIKTKVSRLLRQTSGAREAFFRLLVQRYKKNVQYARVRPSLEQTFFSWVKMGGCIG